MKVDFQVPENEKQVKSPPQTSITYALQLHQKLKILLSGGNQLTLPCRGDLHIWIIEWVSPLSGENRRLVTDEPDEFEKSPVEVPDFRRITDHCRGICRRMYLKWMKAKPEDVKMQPAGFRITRIFTDYAQKLTGHWFSAALAALLLPWSGAPAASSVW